MLSKYSVVRSGQVATSQHPIYFILSESSDIAEMCLREPCFLNQRVLRNAREGPELGVPLAVESTRLDGVMTVDLTSNVSVFPCQSTREPLPALPHVEARATRYAHQEHGETLSVSRPEILPDGLLSWGKTN